MFSYFTPKLQLLGDLEFLGVSELGFLGSKTKNLHF